MSGTTITANATAGLYFNSAGQNPVTIVNTATVSDAAGPGILGSAGINWTITNAGKISATGTVAGNTGVQLNGIGTVSNELGGSITGFDVGVSIAGTGSVVNDGTIIATQATGSGYAYNTTTKAFSPLSGAVVVGSGAVSNAASGLISGYFEGVAIGGAGGLTNAGTVAATGHGFGVALTNGGSVSNAATGTISAGRIGVLALGTNAATVVNQGVIGGGGTIAVDLVAGGVVDNIAGTIAGTTDGVVTGGTNVATVSNQAVISGQTYAGVVLVSGGGLTNVAPGSITGGRYGVVARGLATIDNAGALTGNTVAGAVLFAGGALTNEAGGAIQGRAYGVAVLQVPGTVSNSAAITGTVATGVGLYAGGTVTNAAAGVVKGGYFGIRITGVAGSVTNLGSVSSSATFLNQTGFDAAGVALSNGGIVQNGTSGIIRATWKGVEIGSVSASVGGTLFNQGFIYASNSNASTGAAAWIHGPGLISNAASGTITGGPFGIVSYFQTTIVNFGSIGGTDFAIDAVNPGFANRVIVGPGAKFSGTVAGGNAIGATVVSALELAAGTVAGTIASFGSKYIGFGQVTIDSGAQWTFGGTVVAGQYIDFAGTNAALTLSNPAAMAGTVSDFDATDLLVLSGITDVNGVTLGINNTLTVHESAGPGLTLHFNPAQTIASNAFHYATVAGGTDLTLACFATGTRIRTVDGAVPVEALRPGMRVPTRFGGHAPVVWVGHRAVDCRRHPRPQAVRPVRVRAGAFGPSLPEADLWLSPDHAVFVRDVLIPVRHLVNGTTIEQIACDAVTYWHVELDRHDVLFAEGLPTESYLAGGERADFSHGGSVIRLFPAFGSDPLDLSARWEAGGCAPLVVCGPELDAVVSELAARAASVAARHAAA